MNALIEISEDTCNICYACIRACPVKAIKVTAGDQVPVVVENRCIGCGSCVTACTPLAITYRNGTEQVKYLLSNSDNIIASIDPAIASEFPDISDYRKLVRMLKQIGFRQVYEVSFGVDLVAKQYKKLFGNFRGKYYITANCPVVVAYIEKFHPALVNNIAPIVSPMIAMSRVIREKAGNDVKIVHIGPCIQAKDEAKRYAKGTAVDAVLTFTELRELFDEYKLNESMLEYSHVSEPLGYTGSLYPISNGIIQAASINENLLENTVITGDGKTAMIQYTKAFEQSIDDINSHFNMFFCKGCLMGPGTSKGRNRLERRALVVEYANKRMQSLDVQQWEANVEKFAGLDFSCSFDAGNQRLPEPPEAKIKAILRSIEMVNKEDEIDCGACGYESCRDFATAVAKGLTITGMCTTFAWKNQQNYIHSLQLSNERLSQVQEALKASEQQARQQHELAKEASETITSMLQKLPVGVVLINNNLKILQANHSFIKILGNDAKEINDVVPGLSGADIKTLLPYAVYNIINFVITSNEEIINRDVQTENGLLNISVFPIKKSEIAGAIVRDLSQPDVRKEQIISRVNDVIDKNLEMVQQIGFLLGEGAAETERMLNTVIQAFKSDKSES